MLHQYSMVIAVTLVRVVEVAMLLVVITAAVVIRHVVIAFCVYQWINTLM